MSKRVMICDDSKLMRRLLQDIVVEDGWEVVAEAANGQEAIDLYKQTKPDAVTMDLAMPGTDGLTGLKGIRDYDPNAKVVVVTSMTQENAARKAIQQGARDFITKPVMPEQLLESLSACITQ